MTVLVLAIHSSCVRQRPPGLRTDDAVLLQTIVRLEALDGGLRVGTEDAIDVQRQHDPTQDNLYRLDGRAAAAFLERADQTRIRE